MIKCGKSIRFTRHEVKEFRKIGLDLSDARHEADLERELDRWANIIAYERLDLLEKIAGAMARTKRLRSVDMSAGSTPTDL